MTSVFIDTSALYAALDASDRHHAAARTGWERLIDALVDGAAEAVTHSGVLVEATALVQHRLGIDATRVLHDDLLALARVTSVDDLLHERALAALLAARQRDISLVDWLSFSVMRAEAIDVAFTFDRHFTDQGFAAWS